MLSSRLILLIQSPNPFAGPPHHGPQISFLYFILHY